MNATSRRWNTEGQPTGRHLSRLFDTSVTALKLLRINVPSYTLRGKSALLECRYDLESDKLYSISWYKDHEEFYRYVPRGEPTKHSYRVDGVKVDHRHSDNQRVLLQDVGLPTRGKYRCEVSAEAPDFNSVSAEARMEVIALPQEGPTITGEEKIYASGDVLALNCTSGRSHPAARVKWFINGVQVMPDLEKRLEQHGLFSTVSSLRLELEPNHLASEKINVRCEATIYSSQDVISEPIDKRSTEVFVQGEASLARPSSLLVTAMLLLLLLLRTPLPV